MLLLASSIVAARRVIGYFSHVVAPSRATKRRRCANALPIWARSDGEGLECEGCIMLLKSDMVWICLQVAELPDTLEKGLKKGEGVSFSTISLKDHGLLDAPGLHILDLIAKESYAPGLR